MPNVFITQQRSSVNYSDAARFGELRFVFPQGVPINYNNPRYLIEMVRSAMADAKPDDFFVIDSPVPILFGLAFAEMDRQCDGSFNFLRFEKARGGYCANTIDLNDYDEVA